MNALLHLDVEALPEAIVWNPPLSDDEFEALCFENDSVKLERTKEGRILMHAPASDDTSSANSEIIRQLGNWWDGHERGRVYDSNGGFFLPDTSMLSPDAAYMLPESLGPRSKRGSKMARRCPDFVIELLSPSDSLRKTQAKMLMMMTCLMPNFRRKKGMVRMKRVSEIWETEESALECRTAKLFG